MKKLSITVDDCMRVKVMDVIVKLFCQSKEKFLGQFQTLNQYTFDFIVSRKAKIILGIIYFSALVIALVYFDPLLQVKNKNGGFQMSLICYAIILCFITVAAYCAFLQSNKYSADIVYEAANVELSNSDMQEVSIWSYDIIRQYVSVLAILISVGVAFVFVNNTELDLSSVDGLEVYASFLVFFAALSTILAYTSLILDISAIQIVYNSTFRKYVFFYPVSTKIFREYNKIITRGLIRFWTVGSCVLF